MDRSYNKKGEQYEFLAVAGKPAHYKLFGVECETFHNDLSQHLISRKKAEGLKDIGKWFACFDALKSFCFQTEKLRLHALKIREQTPGPGEMLAITAFEAVSDFESLLYHGRAALDRLGFAISKQTYNQDCDKFTKIPNILENFKHQDTRLIEVIEVLTIGIKEISGILIDDADGKTGLRSLLAHSKTTGEATNHVFSVQRDYGKKIWYFDYDLYGRGIVNTAHHLNKVVPYIILNSISILSRFDQVIDLEKITLSWKPNCISLADYLVDEGKGMNFTTIKPDETSITLVDKHVSKSILLQAEDLQI